MAVTVLTTGCGPDGDPAVHAYVQDAIAAMSDGLYTTTPKWREAVAEMEPQLLSAPDVEATYAGLSELVVEAGGVHSSFVAPQDVAGTNAQYGAGASFPTPTAQTFDGISVLSIPTFDGDTTAAVDTYQNAGITAVRGAAPATTCGWVVDLRNNQGGNAWAMLPIVAPLLDDGNIFGLHGRNGTSWATVSAGDVTALPGDEPPGLRAGFTVHQPVTVLTSTITASAAEVLVVAFAGQSGVARVGTATAGLTTGNVVKTLSDGARIVLSTSTYIDRENHTYHGPIQPDITAPPSAQPGALELAKSELTAQYT